MDQIRKCGKCQRPASFQLESGELLCQEHFKQYEDDIKELAMRDHYAGILEASAKLIRNDVKRSLDEHVRNFMEIFV